MIDGLKLSYGTFLYDGLTQAVATTGKEGQRSIIVLSDGRDTSTTKLTTVTAAIKKADVKVDVVALAQSAGDETLLQPLSDAGGGTVISATDPKALGTGLRERGAVVGQADPGHRDTARQATARKARCRSRSTPATRATRTPRS